jgi:hypothetical protein
MEGLLGQRWEWRGQTTEVRDGGPEVVEQEPGEIHREPVADDDPQRDEILTVRRAVSR